MPNSEYLKLAGTVGGDACSTVHGLRRAPRSQRRSRRLRRAVPTPASAPLSWQLWRRKRRCSGGAGCLQAWLRACLRALGEGVARNFRAGLGGAAGRYGGDALWVREAEPGGGPGLLCGYRAPLPGTGRPAPWAPRGQGGADGPGTPRGRLLCGVASTGPVALPDPAPGLLGESHRHVCTAIGRRRRQSRADARAGACWEWPGRWVGFSQARETWQRRGSTPCWSGFRFATVVLLNFYLFGAARVYSC